MPHDPGCAPFSSLRTQHPTSLPGSTSTGTDAHLMSINCHTSLRKSSTLRLCPGIQTDIEERRGGSVELERACVLALSLIICVTEGKLLSVILSFLIYKT